MIYLGVFATAAATLILEVALTRLFSIAFWYHFAFFVISIALLGFGASGTFLTLFSSLLRQPYKNLSNLSLVFSVSIIAVFVICRIVPFDPARIAWDTKQILYIFVYSFLLSIPFFFSGLTISIAISHAPHIVNKIYFSDLIGAGIGALSVPFIFLCMDGPGILIFASFMAGLGSLFFCMIKKSFNIFLRGIFLLFMFYLLVFMPKNIINYINLSMSPYKDLKVALLYPDARLLRTEWNAFSRVDVVESPAVRYAPGLSLEYRNNLPAQLGLTVDGAGLNAITKYKDEDSGFIPYLPAYLPYYLKEARSFVSEPTVFSGRSEGGMAAMDVLIVEPGGGMPVLLALKGLDRESGSGHILNIDIVERNPLLISFIRDDFAWFAGDIYKHERVNIRAEEARTFLKMSKRDYDIIDFSKPGTILATSTGLYGLLEDYAFTVDAFREYIMKLKDGGILSFTRYLLPPPREEVRIISLAIEAFRKLGIEDPSGRIAAIRSWGTITILIKKTPFDALEIKKIKEFSQSRRFDIVYLKGIRPEETNTYNIFQEDIYYKIFQEVLDSKKRNALYRDYLFDLIPATDDKPFFFHFFRIKKIIPTYHAMKDKWQPFIEGGYLVPVIFIESLALSFFFIILPFIVARKAKRYKENGYLLRVILYFASIGLGFMLIEIAMIQKFILFLGKPIYSVSIVLFLMLVSTATGSYFSKRSYGAKPVEGTGGSIENKAIIKKIKIGVIFILFILVAYYILLDKIFDAFLGLDFTMRFVIAVFVLAPLGFFMGFPFPLGISVIDLYDRRMIPWAWVSNGCASVAAASLAIMIAITFGFSMVFLFAGCIYLFGFTVLSNFIKPFK